MWLSPAQLRRVWRGMGEWEDEQRQRSPGSIEDEDPQLSEWRQTGNTRHLEEMLLEGKESLLQRLAKESPPIRRFLQQRLEWQAKLECFRSALDARDLRQARKILDRPRLVEVRDSAGKTPLHWAAEADHAGIAVHAYQLRPAAVALLDRAGRTPLHLAALRTAQPAEDDQGGAYAALVAAGASPTLKDRLGTKAEQYAEDPDAFKGLSEDGEEEERRERGLEKGMSQPVAKVPLVPLSELLREEGALQKPDVGAEEDDEEDDEALEGGPPDELLEEWLSTGQLDEVERVVLSGGAGRLRRFARVAKAEAADFLDSLPAYLSKMDAIHKAVEEGDVRRVQSLIDRPRLALAQDAKGFTPLHKAVLHHQTDALRFLLANFYETVNAADAEGRTPLHYAAVHSSHYVRLLQRAGADAFIEDKAGHTPFYYRSNPEALNISQYKHMSATQHLLSGKIHQPLLQDLEDDIADWLETGNVGKLEELVLSGYGDLLLARNDRSSDPDTKAFLDVLPQYAWKMKAIHQAVMQGNLTELRSLIDRKKLALCRDSKGATPLHNAILFGQTKLLPFLLDNYPQAADAADHCGRTPMHYAAALGGHLFDTTNLEDTSSMRL